MAKQLLADLVYCLLVLLVVVPVLLVLALDSQPAREQAREQAAVDREFWELVSR